MKRGASCGCRGKSARHVSPWDTSQRARSGTGSPRAPRPPQQGRGSARSSCSKDGATAELSTVPGSCPGSQGAGTRARFVRVTGTSGPLQRRLSSALPRCRGSRPGPFPSPAAAFPGPALGGSSRSEPEARTSSGRFPPSAAALIKSFFRLHFPYPERKHPRAFIAAAPPAHSFIL